MVYDDYYYYYYYDDDDDYCYSELLETCCVGSSASVNVESHLALTAKKSAVSRANVSKHAFSTSHSTSTQHHAVNTLL